MASDERAAIAAGEMLAAPAGFVVMSTVERDTLVARAESAEAERDLAIHRWNQLSVDLHTLVVRSSAFVSESPAAQAPKPAPT